MLFFNSFLLGFAVSAPFGPIGLLVMQRVLSNGRAAGFLTGLGAVTANLIYASVAAFGFSVVSGFLLEHELALKMMGSLFLLYLGVKTFLKKPPAKAAALEGTSLLGMYLSTLLLMLSNPVTILNFTAMFAGLGFTQDAGTAEAAFLLLTGVFLGASFWWLILSLGVSLFKDKITPHIARVNKLAGVLVIVLAAISWIC
ncbi:LysE family translocator [Fictibacillus iocasae]|uniref:LysE family translocator n=1 Tax=Fictibacillus iocasae TaxID=2715437 RepID=A0ABW2NT23_9BACL